VHDPTTEFLNVDLHLKCVTSLEAVCEAFGRSVTVLHRDRLGRKHWVVLELARSPKTPAEAIRRFATVATRLRGRAKAAWAGSEKELDIGIQAGVRPDPVEWVVDAKAVAEAARIGARLRVTVYSPVQLMKAIEKRSRRSNPPLQPASSAGRQ
jgi:hypothetical protein